MKLSEFQKSTNLIITKCKNGSLLKSVRNYSGISVLRTTLKEAITPPKISFMISNYKLVVAYDRKNCPQLLFFS